MFKLLIKLITKMILYNEILIKIIIIILFMIFIIKKKKQNLSI